MADPRGKLPGDLGNADWDSLLSDLERKDDKGAPAQPPKAAATPSKPADAPKEPAARDSRGPNSQPLYRPPAAPAAPAKAKPAARPEPPIEDLDEERTMVGVISRDLIEEAARGAGGLGQLFGKPDSNRRPEPEGVDVSFDESGRHRAAPAVVTDDDHSVMTSAPALEVASPQSAHDRVTPVPAPPSAPDPFAAPRDKALPEVSLDFDTGPGAVPDPFAPQATPAPPSAKRPPAAAPAPAAAPSRNTPIPTMHDQHDDEPTRIGRVLPSDLDEAALRAELLNEPRRPSTEPTPPPTPPAPAAAQAPAKAPAAKPSAKTPEPPASRPEPAAAKAPPARPSAKTPEPPASGGGPNSPRPDTARSQGAPAARPSGEARMSRPDLRVTATEITETEPSGPPSITSESGPMSTGERAIAAVVPRIDLPDERDAMAFLAEVDRLQDWTDRAAWLEQEARALDDKTEQARALLVVSELLAMSGEEERAQALAEEARALAPSLPLAHRQARARLSRERGFEALLEPLDAEAKAATTAPGRAHALLLAADIQRLIAKDPEGAAKKLEQAMRVQPTDPRPHLLQVATELGKSGQASRYRWPEEPSLAPLRAAAQTLSALRGTFDKATPPASAAEAMPRVRAALAEGDVAAAAEALGQIKGDDGVSQAAAWLASVLAAPRAATRPRALEWAARLAESDPAARRRQALWAFEAGDLARATEALAGGDAFGDAERVVAQVLLGADSPSVRDGIGLLAQDDEQRPLMAALASALDQPSPPEAGTASERSASRLGRALAQGGDEADTVVRETADVAPDDLAVRTLALDLSVASGKSPEVAAALASWPRAEGAGADFDRDRSLAAALVQALAGNTAAALAEVDNARQADPVHEATVRLLAALAPDRAAGEIDRLAAEIDDPTRRALLLLEAAVRLGPSAEAYGALLRLAHETAPQLALASALGLEAARRAGDADAQLAWLRSRRDSEHDETDLLREALVLHASDPARSGELLAEAAHGRDDAVALHELLERMAPGKLPADWRAARAARASGPNRVLQAFRAALDLEREHDHASAARLAQLALDAGGGPLAALLRDRNDAFGPGAARLADELIAIAKAPPDLASEREAYERLATLDETGRNDPASALQWHRALLERDPTWLPSLRRLEHQLTTEGRDDELEPVATIIAQAITGPESAAHAQLASRLRLRQSVPWDGTRDLVMQALRQDPPGAWALRQGQAHAQAASDAATTLRVSLALARRTAHSGEQATLLLRAAEAAEQLGDPQGATAHLRSALELVPGHIVARTQLAELLERTGDLPAAAEAFDEAARAHHQPHHQVPLWYRAALLWLDKAGDKPRGTAALEAAAALNVLYNDTFDRLRALYIEAREGHKLASLLQRRLATEEDPDRRVELEVALGRAFTELGDRQEAKRALAAALDRSPDHTDALRAFVDLCAAEEDWDNAEQALIRLGRLVSDPDDQADLYSRLGDIYRLHLNNFERAELSYLEILKRIPDSPSARERLVKLYAAQGNKEKALEIQSSLLASAASDPAAKRQRTIELAQLHEQAGDPKKAEQILETLRKEFPHETQVLRALAEFHTRHNHGPAVNVLLDRAAADARRALATGRFELHFFANLATVFELRGNHEAAATANGTVAALEGRPCEVQGVGLRGVSDTLDDLLAPDIFTPAFRDLLRRANHVLEAASVVDLKGLRAAPLPPTSAAIGQKLVQLANAFGLPDLQVYTSPTLGSACLPAGTDPYTLVLGSSLLSEQHEAIRTFLALRALKCLQTGVDVFCRTAPIDLWPLTAAFLQLHAPSWNPQGVDANKMRDFKGRLQKALTTAVTPELTTLATEVAGSIGNRASTLQTSANSWGARCALLVTGDATSALDAIAWAAGQTAGAPPTNPDRMKWIGRNAEARDLIIYSVSDAYSEARSR